MCRLLHMLVWLESWLNRLETRKKGVRLSRRFTGVEMIFKYGVNYGPERRKLPPKQVFTHDIFVCRSNLECKLLSNLTTIAVYLYSMLWFASYNQIFSFPRTVFTSSRSDLSMVIAYWGLLHNVNCAKFSVILAVKCACIGVHLHAYTRTRTIVRVIQKITGHCDVVSPCQNCIKRLY